MPRLGSQAGYAQEPAQHPRVCCQLRRDGHGRQRDSDGTAHAARLLRESFRENGKVKNRTPANLSKLPADVVENLRILLRGGEAVESFEESLEVLRSLSQVERAFRTMKSIDLKVRPIHQRLAERVKAHVFPCMPAYYVEWHMRKALAPILFDDHDAAKGRPSAPKPPDGKQEVT